MNNETENQDHVSAGIKGESTPQKNPNWFQKNIHLLKITGGILLTALFALLIFAYIAMQSLPGESLYATKVNKVEGLLEALHVSHKSKSKYQVTRMEARLEEIKSLAEKESVSPETLTIFNEQVQRHGNKLFVLIDEAIDINFTKAEVMAVLNDFASVATVIEIVCEDSEKLGGCSEVPEDIRRSTENLYKDKAGSFALTEHKENIYAFIQTRLAEVQDDLNTPNLSEKTIARVDKYLERVEPAITSDNLGKAINVIGIAQRFIKIDTYGGVLEEPVPEAETETVPQEETTAETTSLEETDSSTQTIEAAPEKPAIGIQVN